MIGESGFFVPAVAVAVALFGATSPAALVATVGALTKVSVRLFPAKTANHTKGWLKKLAFICIHTSCRSRFAEVPEKKLR